MKAVQLHEETPKQFLDHSLAPKNSPLGPQKVKKTTLKFVKIKFQNSRKLFNYMSRPQNSCRTLTQLQKLPIRASKSKKMTQKLSKNQKSELMEL